MTSTARTHEATATPVPFEHEGQHLAVLPASEWTVQALEAFEEGKVTTFLRAILTPDSWSTYTARNPKVSDLQGLVVAIQTAAGLSGN
jgi:hypothetical protein